MVAISVVLIFIGFIAADLFVPRVGAKLGDAPPSGSLACLEPAVWKAFENQFLHS